MDNDSKGDRIAALERAIAILDAFRPYEHSASLQTLSVRTGLYKSTLLRQLKTLIAEHCVVRLADGTYQLGARVLHWASVYRTSLNFDQHVPPVLAELVHLTGEGASFFTREGDTRVCLYRADSPKELRDHIRQGDLLPLDKGAAGRALLVYENAASAAQAPSPPVIVSMGEREAEIAAIASPVFDHSGLCGVVALSGPATRFHPQAVQSFSVQLLDATRRLSATLGGHALFARYE